jgi:5'-nucleotidase
VISARRILVGASIAALALAPFAACAPAEPSPPMAPPPPAPTASPATAETAAQDASSPLLHVQILAINDFHGNLEPPAGSNGVVVASASDPIATLPGARVSDAGVAFVPAGGAAYLAAHIARLRAENPDTIVVSAGDLTGASPLLSNLFADEPSIVVMNALGLDYEAVGNHDFDRGLGELTRLAHGGCSLGDCDSGARFDGAAFSYLAANVTDTTTQKTAFAPYAIRDVAGGRARIAFIGETLKATPSIATARAVKGLAFEDEAVAANALVPELKAAGVSAIVLVLHQGAMQSPAGTYDSCIGLSGDLLPVLDRLDPAITIVASGHTHQAYDCTIGGRLVTSAMSYGRLVTKIDLTIDPARKVVVDQHAQNVPVTRDVAPDARVAQIVGDYAARSAALTGRVVGWVKGDFTGNAKAAGSASCETPLGDLIADAQRAATNADIALMNPGGIRADLVVKHAGRPDGAITFAEVFEVQPFGNDLVTMTLTGAQLQGLFEAQFGSRSEPRILQVSDGFTYRYAFDRATNTAKVSALALHGKPLAPTKRYRVTVNSFLAGGGDTFRVLKEGTDRQSGGPDIDALVAYLGKVSSPGKPLAPSRTVTRITGDGCK